MSFLIVIIVVVVLLIIATTKFKVHPFISLLVAAIAVGFLYGMSAVAIIEAITSGFGNTLKSIGIIIACGTIIGAYLEKSGGARTLAEKVLKVVGEKNSVLAMNITGFIVSIPVFCDSGFVILSTLNKALSRKKGISLVTLAVSLSTGLYASHVFIPPTPGPLAAAATLNADIGLVIILGLIVAIPSALSGMFLGKIAGKRLNVSVKEKDVMFNDNNKDIPNLFKSASPILIPIILIALKSIAEYPTHLFGEGLFFNVIVFIGNPVVALLIGVFLAFRLKKIKDKEEDWLTGGLKNAGVIILITGAGGAFGNVLRDTNIGSTIGTTFSSVHMGIILPFLIAAIIKSAQGSSTVSIITTAAVVLPLMGPLGLGSEIGRVLTVLAIGAGSMTVSHVNDSYFWVVAQFSNMDMATALKSHTIATFFQGIVGILVIIILSFLLL